MHEILAARTAAPEPLLEVLVGTIGLVVTIFVHGAAIRFVTSYYSRRWVHFSPDTPLWRVNLMLAATVAALSIAHFAETLLWAIPIHVSGIIPRMRDSFYLVMESYTTLGAGNVSLPDQWRLIGPIIAMSGLFTFSWTASVLVSIMNDFSKLDRARADRNKRGKAGERADPPA